MLSNAYLLAKFRFDTAENERNFAEFLRKTDTSKLDPIGPREPNRAHLPRGRLAERLVHGDRADAIWLRAGGPLLPFSTSTIH